MSSPDLNLVPGAGLQSHDAATCGVHLATLAVGVVYCLGLSDTIEVEVAEVTSSTVHSGPHTVGQPPGSRHRYSEDP